MNTKKIILSAKKEFIYKIITSIFIRGLLLIIPIFWTRAVGRLAEGSFNKAYFLVIIALILSALHYMWEYLNQRTWYRFYNKIYLGFIKLVSSGNRDSIKKLSLGEYNNITSEDIDIICTFLGNMVTRIIQFIEFIIIYIYFLYIDLYLFLITVIVSIVLVVLIILSGKKVQLLNHKRKSNLDKKTIVVHDLYSSIVNNKKNNSDLIKGFYNRSHDYLLSNSRFNITAQSIIYCVLTIIEVSRYLLILYGIHLVFINEMSIDTILLIYTYYASILANFEVMGTINVEYRSFLVSLSRLKRIEVVS